jgi:membrane-associated phospholipid phosphatase
MKMSKLTSFVWTEEPKKKGKRLSRIYIVELFQKRNEKMDLLHFNSILKQIDKKLYLIYILILFISLISYFFFDKTIVLYFHNNLSAPIEEVFEWITIVGEGVYYLVPSLIIYLIYRKSNIFIKNISLFVFLSVFSSGVFVNILKVTFARYRPLMLKEDLFGFSWFDIGYTVSSFPSGHSSTALSAYTAFALLLPKYRYPLLIIGITIALSRVVLTVHYLSDVLVGGLIGSFMAYIMYKIIIEKRY